MRGLGPHYRETFVGEGDIGLLRVLRIWKKNGFADGLLPDAALQLTCAAPWHAGMAWACAWMQAALQARRLCPHRRRGPGPSPSARPGGTRVALGLARGF
jgi:hypothetical protein